MPRIVAYTELFESMRALNLRSLYYNSGAFGFETDIGAGSVGWICDVDASLRPEARLLARLVPKPAAEQLTQRLTEAVTTCLPPPVWVMPKSHWAFELDFGSRAWMPQALPKQIGIDPASLASRTTGDAIEFAPGEITLLSGFVQHLLTNLAGSDFALAFPGKPVICTLHHHKQIWWTTRDPDLLQLLQQLAA